jgi:hypothetical protein
LAAALLMGKLIRQSESESIVVKSTDILILNLEEIRRRGLKVWQGIPDDRLDWKPDPEAMTSIEMVRHVLEGEFLYMSMLERGGSLPSEDSPFKSRSYGDVESEVSFARPYRQQLLELIATYSERDLLARKVNRADKGYVRSAGDFILRMGYHEAIHTGHMLGYLRAMNVPRPNIWD